MKEGITSEQLLLRVPKSIKAKIEREVGDDKDYRTVSEFVLQSIRFYLDYISNKRIKEAETRTVVTRGDDI